MTCTKCQRPIVASFQPDKGDWQRVWANTKDGPAHTPSCPAKPLTPATATGD